MGTFFDVSRVGYGHLDPVKDVFDYSICWTDGSVPPLLGRFPASAFGVKIVERLRAGATVVVEDLQADPLSDEPQRARPPRPSTRAPSWSCPPCARVACARSSISTIARCALAGRRDRLHGGGRRTHPPADRARRGRGCAAGAQCLARGACRGTHPRAARRRGGLAPVAEDGGDRPADRRHCATTFNNSCRESAAVSRSCAAASP